MKKCLAIVFMVMTHFVSFANPTDTEPPVWTSQLPQDITVECNNIPAPINLYATDNSGTVTVIFNYQTFEGNCPGNYTILYIWTATDPSGNSISYTQTITVIDTTAPYVIGNYPGDITVNCDAIPNPSFVQFLDNCGAPNVTFSEETLYTPENSGYKTIIRTWMAIDACGNSTVHNQTITVIIPETPTIVSISQPTCANPSGTVTIGNLPETDWTLSIFTNSSDLITLTGNTSTITVNLAPEIYSAVVRTSSNCISNVLPILVEGYDLIDYAMQGTYQDYNNDGYVNVGDIIHYEFNVTNNACIPIPNVIVTSATLDINGQLESLQGQTTDNTTFSANHVLTQADINSGSITHSSAVQVTHPIFNTPIFDYSTSTIQLNTSDGLLLNAFLDSNNNGIQDNGEISANYGNFTYQINNGSTVSTASSTGLMYLFESNPTSSYSINYEINDYYSNCFSTSGLTYSNITVPSGSGMTTYNFPITTTPCTNVSVQFSNIDSPRPGFQYFNTILIKNNGTQIIPSGTLIFNSDSVLTINSTSVNTTSSTPNSFTYDYTNLEPNQTLSITVVLNVPTLPTVSLGQIVTNTASITTPIGDSFVLDNSATLTRAIAAAYDPNDKQEHHGGQIEFASFTADDYLTYTIRFENTGNANAINVSVDDVLDAQLDESSIRMIDASHDYILERIGSNLTWRFDGINLPPSVPNSQIGHGFITFQIKPKAGYAIGDIIPNTADIYFDFNPAIVTNTCNTEFVETLSNSNFAFTNLNFFPNPVKNSLTISNESVIDSIEITSVLSQKMASQIVNSLQTEVDLSALSSGIYFVKVISGRQEKTIKIVKE